MSKSLGNTWRRNDRGKERRGYSAVMGASSDYTEDLRIGQDIIKSNVEAYRRLRNTSVSCSPTWRTLTRRNVSRGADAGAGALYAGASGGTG